MTDDLMTLRQAAEATGRSLYALRVAYQRQQAGTTDSPFPIRQVAGSHSSLVVSRSDVEADLARRQAA